MKKLLSERTIELDADESLRSGEKVTKLYEYGLDLGFSFHELIDEIHNALSETFSENDPSLATELPSNMTFSPLPSIPVNNRRRTSKISGKDSRCSRVDAKQTQFRGSLMRWTTMRKIVQERDSNALLKPTFHPWRENDEQERFVRNLDAGIMKTWGVFFCGGGEGVISVLREISIDYNIDLHIDSYAW
jgi:hypothetical protein